MRKIMGNRLLIAALIASTAPALLSGCAAVGALGTGAEVVAAANKPLDEVFKTRADEQAYFALLQFEVGANKLASQAVDMGLLQAGSPRAIKVADLLLQLTAVVEAAKAAKNVNDAASLSDKIKAGRSLSRQVLELLS